MQARQLFEQRLGKWRTPAVGPVVVGLLMTVFVFLLYQPTLKYPFVFDDGHNIVNNPNLHIDAVTLENLIQAGFEKPTPNRPLPKISFALNYYFNGTDASAYRLVNILIHILSGIILYFLLQTTLALVREAGAGGRRRWISLLAALIWLVHPLQTQSVIYVVQRMNALATMFYILSVFLFVRARLKRQGAIKGFLFAGCAVSGLFAMGSKEIAATLPVFILLYEWYFFQDMSRTWLKKNLFWPAVLAGFIVLAGFFFVGSDPLAKIMAGYAGRDFTLGQRLLTEFRVVIFYITLMLFPHPSRLNLDHDFPLSSSLIDPPVTLVAILAVGTLTGLALYGARKERFLSFCVLWFLGNLVIESSVIPLEIIFEHRVYLPMMFGIPAVVYITGRYIRPAWIHISTMVLVIGVLALWTHDRNRVWQNEVSLWQDSAKKSPGKARPHYNLGLALEKSGRRAEAVRSYRQTIRINPNHFKAYNNLGVAHAQLGRLQEAVHYYLQSLRINPNFERAHHNLGLALAGQGKLDPAIEHLSEAVRIDPYYANAHHNLGIALAAKGRLGPAVRHLKRAIQIKPDFAEAYNNLGLAQLKQGNPQQAAGSFLQALRIDPAYSEAQRNLRITLGKNKNGPDAKAVD